MRGYPSWKRLIEGSKSRLRPILLTSATTVQGIAPLMLERSFQAKFLIPMGLSIAAGLLFATVLTLVGIPALYLIQRDAHAFLARMFSVILGRPIAAPEPAV